MLVLRLACVVASSAALAAKRARAGFAQPPPADDRRARRLARVWPAGAKVDAPAAPTWDELSQLCGDAVAARTAAADASVVFWRDAAHWCPYCQSFEIVLGERRIDHVVRCVPLRCYGEKPAEFVDVAGADATLPVLIVDGRVRFPSPEHPPVSFDYAFSAIERELATAYGVWLVDGRRRGIRERFHAALDALEATLSDGRHFFGGTRPSCEDATMAPTLERAAAVAAYFKGDATVAGGRVRSDDELAVRGIDAAPRHPLLQAWAERFAERGHWRRADWYTHAHSLPVQLGGQSFDSFEIRDLVDGAWILDDGLEDSTTRRRQAAALLARNTDAIARFAARGCRKPTKRERDRTTAPLADADVVDVPEAALPAIDALVRLVAARLLAEDDTTRASVDAAAATAARSVPVAPAHAAMAYLRDRVGVPRDADHPVAHELRCGLNWMCK
ncbi:unnamed protein product, partial [Pelagomonas calceolata]